MSEDLDLATDAIARERVARLLKNWDWPDPVILEEIVALGEAAIPAIQDALTPALVFDSDIDDQAGSAVFYLAQALGAIGSPKALPLLIDLYRQVDDDMIETLPDAFVPIGPEAIDPLLTLVADASLTWFQRARAAETASSLAGDAPELRARVAAGLRLVLAEFLSHPESLTDDEQETVASVVSDLANLADAEARSLIDAAFAAGIVGKPVAEDASQFDSITITSREDVEETYREGGRSDFWSPRPFLERYPEDRRRHFEEEEKARKVRLLFDGPEDNRPQPVVLGPRLSRNNPCWCGSGKKYKKCHLNIDEEERRVGGQLL